MMHFISKEEKKEKTKGNIYEGFFLFLFFFFLTFSSSLKRQFTTVILIMQNGLGT